MTRKSFSAEFKAQVAIEAIKGNKTINELVSEFSVHATQINAWKKQMLSSMSDVFSSKRDKDMLALEKEREQLYSCIGKLKVQLDWLKKKAGYLD